jgi:hypothetical protein
MARCYLQQDKEGRNQDPEIGCAGSMPVLRWLSSLLFHDRIISRLPYFIVSNSESKGG